MWLTWFIFLKIVGLLVSSFCYGEKNNFFSVSPTKIEPGQKLFLTIRIPHSLYLSNKEEEQEMILPEIQDSLLWEKSSWIILEKKTLSDSQNFVWEYELTNYFPGTHSIPPISIQVGSQTYSTELQRIEIITTREENDFAMREDFPEIPRPMQWEKAGILSVFILSTLILFGFFLKQLIKKWQQKKFFSEKQDFPLNLEEWLRDRVKEIETKIGVIDVGENFDSLIFSIRKYLSLKKQKPIQALTTKEIQKKFSQDFLVERFRKMIEISELSRFSKEKKNSQKEIFQEIMKETKSILLE